MTIEIELVERGEKLIDEGQFESAQQLLQNALANDQRPKEGEESHETECRVLLGITQFKLGNREAGLQELSQAESLLNGTEERIDGLYCKCVVRVAKELANAGDWSAAISCLRVEVLAQQYGGNSKYWDLLVNAFAANNEIENGVEFFEGLDGNIQFNHYGLGFLHRLNCNRLKSVAAFNDELALAAAESGMFGEGDLDWEHDSYDLRNRLNELEVIVAENIEEWWDQELVSRCDCKWFNECVSFFLDHSIGHFQIGISCFHVEEFEQAEIDLKIALATSERDSCHRGNILFWLGRALAKTGKRDYAIRCLEEACRLQPDSLEYVEALVSLRKVE